MIGAATEADAAAAARKTEERKSFCRICTGHCGLILTVDEDETIVSVRGDKDAPLSQGYACFKGLQAEAAHHGPERILHPRKRLPDGSYVEIDMETALDEIAGKLGKILDRHGPIALAAYVGNGGLFTPSSFYMIKPFLTAFGSDQYFSSVTLDQSSKLVSLGRLGAWRAGFNELDQADVIMCFGTNPLVSHGAAGLLMNDPVRKLKQARARGMKLIVVDPRNSETARNSDLLLQPYPGQDSIIAGAIAKLILDEGWHDAEFCDLHVGAERMAELRAAIEPLTPEFAEHRAGLEPGNIRQAAEMFARDGTIGRAITATGISMGPGSDLAQHMVDLLNVICGRFVRAGDPVRRVPMGPSAPVHAEVIPPFRLWETTGPSRIRGTRLLYGERPSSTLADEILTPGPDQIRALFIDGGDPITAFPDTARMAKAFEEIDLLVSIDPYPTPTTSFAHYVLPPRMQYEREDLPLSLQGRALWPDGWLAYTGVTIEPPKGSDVAHAWYIFWAIARRLGKQIVYHGSPLDMENVPETDDLLGLLLADSPFSLDELRKHPEGLNVDLTGLTVQPARPEAEGARFDPMPQDVAEDLANLIADGTEPGRFVRDGRSYSHLLAVRRMRDLFCGIGRYVDTVRERTPYNPLRLHPDDMAAQGLSTGDRVEVASSHGRVVAIVSADDSLKPGVVTLAHGWGPVPGENADVTETGSAVNALIDADRHYERYNAMPHMSGVPVDIIKLP